MYTSVKLIKIESNQEISPSTYSHFYYNFQIGVLLSLKEDGILSEIQYRKAENVLRRQLKGER